MPRKRRGSGLEDIDAMHAMGAFPLILEPVIKKSQESIKAKFESELNHFLEKNPSEEEQKLFLEFIRNVAIDSIFHPRGRKIISPLNKLEGNDYPKNQITAERFDVWQQRISNLQSSWMRDHDRIADALAPGYKKNKKDILELAKDKKNPENFNDIINQAIELGIEQAAQNKVEDARQEYKEDINKKISREVFHNIARDLVIKRSDMEARKFIEYIKEIKNEFNKNEIPLEIWNNIEESIAYIPGAEKLPGKDRMKEIFGDKKEVKNAIKYFENIPKESYSKLRSNSFNALSDFAFQMVEEKINSLPLSYKKPEPPKPADPAPAPKRSYADRIKQRLKKLSIHRAAPAPKPTPVPTSKPAQDVYTTGRQQYYGLSYENYTSNPVITTVDKLSELEQATYETKKGEEIPLFASSDKIKSMADDDKTALIEKQEKFIEKTKKQGREFVFGGSAKEANGSMIYVWYHPDHTKEGADRDAHRIVYRVKPDGKTKVLFGEEVEDSVAFSQPDKSHGIGAQMTSINNGKAKIIGDESNKISKTDHIGKHISDNINRALSSAPVRSR